MSALVIVDDPLGFLLRYPASRGFGVVTPGLERYGRHTGIDTAAPQGTPVYALGGGEVTLDDDDARFDPADSKTWSGIAVRIRHDDGAVAWYAHLSANTVAAGQRVPRGGLIGYVGKTGASTGAHLHWQVDVDGKPVDPLDYFRAKLRAPDAEPDRPWTLREQRTYQEDVRSTDIATKALLHALLETLAAKGIVERESVLRMAAANERAMRG